MAKIFLVRHGQTLFNVQHKTQGHCDSPLTKEGIQMAINLGDYFEKNGISFDHGYCSTSERTEDTLNYICKNSVEYTRYKSLKEVNFGPMEGGSDVEIFARFPDLKLGTYDKYLGPLGLENMTDAFNRFNDELINIGNSAYSNVLVVSHGLVIANWIWFKGAEFESKYRALKATDFIIMRNCDCLVLEYKDTNFEPTEYILNEKL